MFIEYHSEVLLDMIRYYLVIIQSRISSFLYINAICFYFVIPSSFVFLGLN